MQFDWTNYLKNNFENFKNDVLNEMVSFYGENYREILTKRLNSTNFIFYGNTRFGVPNYPQRFCPNKKMGKKDIVYKSIDIDYNYDINYYIYKIISEKSHVSCQFEIYNSDNASAVSIVLFPLYKTDQELIHEMIHSVTSTPLSLTPHINKCGLITSQNSGEVLLEECITELEDKIIYNRLKNKGVKTFLKDHQNISMYESFYDMYIPVIFDFYKTFHNLIEYARITSDKSSLIDLIGEYNYKDFIKYIDEYKVATKNGILNNLIDFINNSVDNMKAYSKSAKKLVKRKLTK